MKKFVFYKQLDARDCGLACVRMIAKHYGRTFSVESIRNYLDANRQGVSLLDISDAAETIGFKSLRASITFEGLLNESITPFIALWNQNHFVVVYEISKKFVFVADPLHGLIKYSHAEFLNGWLAGKSNNAQSGIVLLLEPTVKLYEEQGDEHASSNIFYIFRYLSPYKRYIIQLFLGMIVGSLLQLIIPFLSQALVDKGIANQNINFVYLILIGQLVIAISNMSIGLIRGWLLLHMGARINITILSDFFIKLMRLPISYFDAKMTGDLLQRISDHRRIEAFLSSSVLSVIFSIFNIVIFSFILAYYNVSILLAFFVGSLVYVLWLVVFLPRRRVLDFKSFDIQASNQSAIIQLITGMQEIKLHNSEKRKRWEWEGIQAKAFKLNIKSLTLNQYQSTGTAFINELKNIVISYMSAKSVIEGDITLGMMLAVQFIIGQLNAPINSIIGFVHTTQDAKISFERLAEIYSRQDEELDESELLPIPDKADIDLQNVDFSYSGAGNKVIENLNLRIPYGKTTAIVGTSGSGKTTLVKLMLKFYSVNSGNIFVGGVPFNRLSHKAWREKCGSVMQDGFIFSDTITRNIAVSGDAIDVERLLYASKVANIDSFITSLPLGYNTKIGAEGMGISQGQKQRILIARAVYKDPQYIFFDEATNALDANNERTIVENMDDFLRNKTVVIVAHRLSTVVNADQIIVMNNGRISEQGSHNELISQRGEYYGLVRNQLELGT